MKIRAAISLYLGPFILIIICAIFFLNYYMVRRALTENAQKELSGIHHNIHRAAQVLLSTAIHNYLRGITEKNTEYIQVQYDAFVRGAISEKEAKENVQRHFNMQSVGTSGYLVAVEEKGNTLFLDLHPFLPGAECTDTEGCREWGETRNGYIEYNWKNPLDNTFRKKAAYVKEFPGWNWIVGASSYRDEFVNLVDIEDLRKLISPIRINTSGYFFLFDEEGILLIHPEFEKNQDRDYINSQNENIIQLLRESKSGYLTYLWKNPSDKEEREKYAFVDKLEGYDWYLVASGYLSEVYQPIQFLKRLTLFIILITGGMLLLLIVKLSRDISIPLSHLKQAIDHFYEEKVQFRWQKHPIEEINVLGRAFAQMTEELNQSMLELQEKHDQLAASELENEENRLYLDSIINSMPSIIIGVNPDLMVTQWNSQAENITGIRQSASRGRLLFEVFPDLQPYAAVLRESLALNQAKTLPHIKTGADGRTHYYEITVYPLVSQANEGAVLRIDETTDRVEMDQRLRHSQKMDAVGQLAGGIAHDFNNMLSGIIGAADLLRTKVRPEEQKLVRIISEASGRTGELIQKLLAFSRKESIAFVSVNIHTVIMDTCEILKRSLDKRITVETELMAESAIVNGDWSQLQSSLLNIGINSGHAMPDGGTLTFSTANITLDESVDSEDSIELPPGSYLHLDVRDSGCGIAKEHLRHIFEPFFTTRKQSEGTGLGLAAVYGAIQQHRGVITVFSELDKGTCFSIYLPLVEGKEQQVPERKTIERGEGCLLIIDDEPVVRATARMMLERLGYTILEAENGRIGLEVYRQHRQGIDVVILDMIMPVMDGTECFYQLKKLNENVKVIISSGFTRDADLSGLKEDGLFDFVRKPYSMEQLSQVVAQAIRSDSP